MSLECAAKETWGVKRRSRYSDGDGRPASIIKIDSESDGDPTRSTKLAVLEEHLALCASGTILQNQGLKLKSLEEAGSTGIRQNYSSLLDYALIKSPADKVPLAYYCKSPPQGGGYLDGGGGGGGLVIQALNNINSYVSQRKAAITLQGDEGHGSDGGGQSRSPDWIIDLQSEGDGDSGTSPTDDQSGRAFVPPSNEQQPPPPPTSPPTPPPPPPPPPSPHNAPPSTDEEAAPVFNLSKVIESCLLTNASVGFLSTDIRFTASKDLPAHASCLFLSAACCSAVGSVLCLGGRAMQHSLGHIPKAQKFAPGMIGAGCAVTACGFLSIMGAQLPEHVNIWATLAGCSILIFALTFLFKKLVK